MNVGGGRFDLATSSNGDAVISALDSNNEIVIQIVDHMGNKIQSTRLVSMFGFHEHKLLVDSQGNIIIIWSDNNSNLYAKKYNHNLDTLWTRMVNNIDGWLMTFDLNTVAAAVDSQDNYIIAWQDWRNYTYNSRETDIYMQKLDSNGNRLWNNNDVKITDLRLRYSGDLKFDR